MNILAETDTVTIKTNMFIIGTTANISERKNVDVRKKNKIKKGTFCKVPFCCSANIIQ